MTLLDRLQDNTANGTAAASGNVSGNSTFNVTAPSTCVWETNSGAGTGKTVLHFVVSTGTDIIRFGMNANNDICAYSLLVQVPAVAPTGNSPVFTIRTTGGVAAKFGFNSSNRPYMMDSVNTQTFIAGAGVLTAGAWYRFEFRIHGNSTTAGDMQVNVYNPTDTSSPVATMTHVTNANLTAVTLAAIELGNSTPSAIDFKCANLRINDGSTTEIGPLIAASNSLRPSSLDSNVGSWTNVGGLADISAALADESDTTYAQGPDNPGTPGKVFVVKFAGSLAAGQPTVKTRYGASASSPVTQLQVELLQGPNTSFTQIATRTINPASTGTNDHAFTCTSGEAATITDRTALYVRYTETS